ncbi:uncharacterized protein LOC143233532 [Tachypleus tridentatus]|uniref:uncharacterized protein LOC143233532 n=1 Tax=Tachypleus tridentatus TaxID=6853 RepID=UPI003FD44A8C
MTQKRFSSQEATFHPYSMSHTSVGLRQSLPSQTNITQTQANRNHTPVNIAVGLNPVTSPRSSGNNSAQSEMLEKQSTQVNSIQSEEQEKQTVKEDFNSTAKTDFPKPFPSEREVQNVQEPVATTTFQEALSVATSTSDDKYRKENIQESDSDGGQIDSSTEHAKLPPFRKGRVDAREHKPKHYEIESLEIGQFVVHKPEGKNYNKLKVIFSKRKFVYEFESPGHLRTKKMTCIVVPFMTVTAMRCEGDVVKLLVDREPAMFLGVRHQRVGIIASANLYDTSKLVDVTDGEIKSCPLHKITLRHYQAAKMKMYLWHFDTRFKYLTELPLEGRSFLGELPLPEPDTEPIAKRRCAKKPLEDSRNKTLLEMLQAPPDVKSLYSPTTCSCRISCRTGRCSCAKMIRKCSMLSCMCGDCDNPLNVLESMEIDLEKVISDPCLLYNVYKVTNLRRYLLGTVVLPCCGYIATLLDVVPGLRDCPNGNCRKKLQFSWCRGYVCEESVNPRNHCNTCMKCCVMDEKHCMVCHNFVVFTIVQYVGFLKKRVLCLWMRHESLPNTLDQHTLGYQFFFITSYIVLFEHKAANMSDILCCSHLQELNPKL